MLCSAPSNGRGKGRQYAGDQLRGVKTSMVMLLHPLSGTEYRRLEDGTVLVRGRDGVEGIFDRNAAWISGERRTADPGLCRWVSDGYMGGGLKDADLFKSERGGEPKMRIDY